MSKYPFAETMAQFLKRVRHTFEGVPLVAPIIPRTGGWSGDNQLGREQPYAPDNRGTQTILKLDEWGPPEIWTVSLYVKHGFKTFDGFKITAEINFGAGGSTQSLEVDWLNGAQISLPMNAVNVIAKFSDVDVSVEGSGLSLGVQLSRGSRGGTAPPVKTIAEFVEGNNTVNGSFHGDLYEIPKFAKNIIIVPDEEVGFPTFFSADFQAVLFSGNSGGGVASAAVDGTKTTAGIQLRLPVVGEARILNVKYVGAGVLPRYTAYAELEG